MVTLPDWLIRDHLLDYLNYEEQIGEGIFNVLKCSEYFQNYSYSVNIIKNLILDNIHVDNAIDYLSESYAKLNYSSLNNLSVDTCWFDLFYISLDTVGRNFVYYISEPNLNQRIKSFDKKVIEEILEKFFSYVKGEDDMQLMTQENIELIITFMSEVNNVKNVFDLLTSEYMNICSEESIHDLSTIPNPHLVVKIPKDFENFYNEFNYDLGLNNKQLIFEIYYRKLDDTLHVSLKLKNKTNQSPNDTSSCMNVLTFLSIVKFEPKNNLSKIFKPQVNIKSLTNSKCLHNICVVKKFKMSLNENSVYSAHDVVGHSTNFHNDFGDYFRIHSLSEGGNNFYTVQIYLKLCFLHSIAGSHLITNFQLICKDPNIHKMTRQLFILLLRKFLTQQGYEDCILVAMINWFKDELNINEDLTEILDELRWENVSPVLIFEFVMKFCSKIKTPETKESLMNILQGRTNEENFSQMFMSCLFGKDGHNINRCLKETELHGNFQRE